MEDVTETDAMALSGRNCVQVEPHYEQAECVESLENVPWILQSIPDPPSDWKLNCLLDEIADKVNNVQLERLKALFRGNDPDSIGKGKLEKCTTCIQFFNTLKERGFISKDNLFYLQKFLYLLNNKELIEKHIYYCRTYNKPYVYKEEFNEAEVEESRRKSVKFHLKGGDHLEKNHQRNLRDRVADILFVPHEHVLIIGVELVASLCVTLLIPKTYADVFQNMLKENLQFEELTALSIDWIYIDDQEYNLTETDEISKAEQQETIVSIYDLYKEKSQLLEETELKNLELQKNLDAVKQMLDIEKKRRIELENQCKLQNNVYKGFKNEVLVH